MEPGIIETNGHPLPPSLTPLSHHHCYMDSPYSSLYQSGGGFYEISFYYIPL